ncbi:Regulator of G-protein signaling 17, partial [Nibea albiflora]
TKPSAEEIRLWSQSFDKLMRNPAGRNVFREFLRTEYSEENMLFWLACEDLKQEINKSTIEEKARSIYEDYISILSPKEVSLDARVREVINRKMQDPTPHAFEDAQLQIYTLMHRDSYPRFLSSNIYKSLIHGGSRTFLRVLVHLSRPSSDPALCLKPQDVCSASSKETPNRTWYHAGPSVPSPPSSISPMLMYGKSSAGGFHNKHNGSFLRCAFSPLFITSVNTPRCRPNRGDGSGFILGV